MAPSRMKVEGDSTVPSALLFLDWFLISSKDSSFFDDKTTFACSIVDLNSITCSGIWGVGFE